MRTPVVLLTALCTAFLLLPEHARSFECGDVDNDGTVRASDALMVLKSAVGAGSELSCARAAAPADVEARVTAMEEVLSHFTVEGNNLVLSGMNLQIVNGTGATDGDQGQGPTVNGLGNLIIGYDESDVNRDGDPKDDKTGSHNLIIGARHTYTSFGGIVAGEDNAITGEQASVLGGVGNIATAEHAVVVTGQDNEASDFAAVVVGGSNNFATGETSAILGGTFNRAIAEDSTVSAGVSNDAQGFASGIAGGEFNRAVGSRSTVSGGTENFALGTGSTVSGGTANSASSFASTVGGGRHRTVTGTASWCAGGLIDSWCAGH